MTKEKLETEAREYLAEHSEYSEAFGQTFVAVDTLTAMVGFAEQETKELEAQIEKMKLQYDYAFNQLCKSREILCSMLSQYKDRKEIDYSTKERGEKLLKKGVYKYD